MPLTDQDPDVGGVGTVGSPPVGGPVYVGGIDGTNLRGFLTDTSGRPVMVGAGVAGTPAGGVLSIQGVASGTPVPVSGTAASGAAVSGNPVRIGASDGTNARDLIALNTPPVGTEYGLVVRPIERTQATYLAIYDQIVPANNKYLATLFSTSATRKVIIQRVWIYDWNFNSGANSAVETDLIRITARTSGTGVTIRAEDSADSLSAGITADTNSTVVTESYVLRRFQATNGVLSTNNGSTAGTANFDYIGIAYERAPGTRGWTLRQNEGLTVKCVQNVTAGNISIVIEFTDEAA